MSGVGAAFSRKRTPLHRHSTPLPGGASAFELAWPVLANYNVWNGARRSAMDEYMWLDDTKKPLAKS